MAPAGGLERHRSGGPGELVTLCAPFLLECIGLLPGFYLIYWKTQHIGPPFSKEIVLADDPETYIHVSLLSNSRGSEFTEFRTGPFSSGVLVL